jgi:hypothetical protein
MPELFLTIFFISILLLFLGSKVLSFETSLQTTLTIRLPESDACDAEQSLLPTLIRLL